jgi:hypothetical protein
VDAEKERLYWRGGVLGFLVGLLLVVLAGWLASAGVSVVWVCLVLAVLAGLVGWLLPWVLS